MDFLDPAKKRAHNRRLFIGYFLVGVTIILTSIILLILANGYDVDRKTGQVIQNGLIFTAASPESAEIFLNGKSNGDTDKRLTVPAAKYDVELRRTGYRTWKKAIELDGGSIERLVYPKLFPNKLNQATSQTFNGTPAFSTQSPDRRWVLVSQPGSVVEFQVFDTANPEDEPKTIQVPRSIMTAPAVGVAESIALVEWSSDNRHVLVQHSYGDQIEFVMIDRQDVAASLNVNNTLSVNPTKVTLRDKRFDRLYLYDASTLELTVADTKSKVVTPRMTQVISYKSYGGDVVLYSTKNEAQPGKTIVKLWDKDKAYTLRIMEESDMLLDLARYDGTWYMAVTSVKEGKLYVFKDPFDKLKADKPTTPTSYIVMKIPSPTKLAFSANTRFVSVQSAGHFVVYDFEENERFNYTVPGDVPATQEARWMDGHRLLLSQNNKVVVFEFDGMNRQELSAIIADSLPYFDRDYERLYTLTPAKDDATKASLTRTSLKLNLAP